MHFHSQCPGPLPHRSRLHLILLHGTKQQESLGVVPELNGLLGISVGNCAQPVEHGMAITLILTVRVRSSRSRWARNCGSPLTILRKPRIFWRRLAFFSIPNSV